MTFKPGTIKLAAANAVFSETDIQFEPVEFAGKVVGWKTTDSSPIQERNVNLTECVQSVVSRLYAKSDRNSEGDRF